MKYLIFLLFLLPCIPGKTQSLEKIVLTHNEKVGYVGYITLRVNQKDTIFEVFEGSRGGLYVCRISGKTGNEYKQYLKDEQTTCITYSKTFNPLLKP